MMFEIQDLTPDRDLRVAIVAARFNDFIVDRLVGGAGEETIIAERFGKWRSMKEEPRRRGWVKKEEGQ